MNLNREYELIYKLQSLNKEIDFYKSMWDQLKSDLTLLFNGYKFFFIIDFYNIHRYIDPISNGIFPVDEDQYLNEQTALKYLFERSNESLLLIDPYVEEIRDYYSSMISLADKFRFVSNKISREFMTYSYSHRIENLDQFVRELLNLDCNPEAMLFYKQIKDVYSQYFEKHSILELNIKRNEMFKKTILKRLDYISDEYLNNNNISYYDTLDTSEVVKTPLYLKFQKLRPHSYLPNIRDATALHSIRSLNNLNSSKKYIFLLFSDAPIIRDSTF